MDNPVPGPDSQQRDRVDPEHPTLEKVGCRSQRPPAASSTAGRIPRLFPQDPPLPPQESCPSPRHNPPDQRAVFPRPPGPALTCVRGRAVQSPGPPGSGGQVWGCWTCPPETCPLETRCKKRTIGHRRGLSRGTRSAACLGHSWGRGWGTPS